MVKNLLFIAPGVLHNHASFQSFINGDIQPDTVIATGAMGRTSETLLHVSRLFVDGKNDDALRLFHQVKEQHNTLAKYLLVKEYLATQQKLNDLYTEIEWLLHDIAVRAAAYYTDQIVGIGPILNSLLLSSALRENRQENLWQDARDFLYSNESFGNAALLPELFNPETAFTFYGSYALIVMPWMVSSTTDNETTCYEGQQFINILKQKAPAIRIQVLNEL